MWLTELDTSRRWSMVWHMRYRSPLLYMCYEGPVFTLCTTRQSCAPPPQQELHNPLALCMLAEKTAMVTVDECFKALLA